MDDLTNRFLGGYHFQWRLARGGMATVYVGQRADDPTGPYVALKVLHRQMAANPVIRQRFRREAELGRRLKHRNIVQVFGLVEAEGRLFMVMQYLAGGSLADRIEEQGAMGWMEALGVLKQVGRALDYAHGEGVVHRDVKPSNILFDQYGDAYLADFGVAHEADASTLTGAGFQPGTVAYMSPEQIKGEEVDPRSDQFSLAVVFYRMLTGELPFEGTTTAALTYQIVHKSPRRLPRRPDIPRRAQKALDKALSKEPGDRYEHVGAFVRALEEATLGGGGAAIPWKAVAGAAVGLIAVALLAFALMNHGGRGKSPSGVAQARAQGAVTITLPPSTPAQATSSPASTKAAETPLPAQASSTVASPDENDAAQPGADEGGLIVDTPQPTQEEGGLIVAAPSPASADSTSASTRDEAPTPTLVPTPTPTPSPMPTPTRHVRPTRPRATQPPGGAGQSAIQVRPLSPSPGAVFDGGSDVTFRWKAVSGKLGTNQKFEMVFFRCNQDPMLTGFSPIGATRDTRATVNLAGTDSALGPLFDPGKWCWGVIVGHEKNGQWIRERFASEKSVPFIYQSAEGGSAPQPPTSPPPWPPGED